MDQGLLSDRLITIAGMVFGLLELHIDFSSIQQINRRHVLVVHNT